MDAKTGRRGFMRGIVGGLTALVAAPAALFRANKKAIQDQWFRAVLFPKPSPVDLGGTLVPKQFVPILEESARTGAPIVGQTFQVRRMTAAVKMPRELMADCMVDLDYVLNHRATPEEIAAREAWLAALTDEELEADMAAGRRMEE